MRPARIINDIYDYLKLNEQARTMTNKELAERIGCHSMYVSECIKSLQKKNKITVAYSGMGQQTKRLISIVS